MDVEQLLTFLETMGKMKTTFRHCELLPGRGESVAEHSWRLVLMAYLMKDEFPDTDIAKVMLMCAVHDLGEAVTGDIPAFEKTKADEQVEEKAVAGLFDTLPEPYHTELTQLFAEMEERKTPEAKLYKALDKLEALIQHNEAKLSTWLPLEYDLQMTYGSKECSFCTYMEHLRETVREDSRVKIRKESEQQ